LYLLEPNPANKEGGGERKEGDRPSIVVTNCGKDEKKKGKERKEGKGF